MCVVHCSAPTEEEEEKEKKEKKKKEKKRGKNYNSVSVAYFSAPTENALCIVVHFSVQTEKKRRGIVHTTQKTTILFEKQTNNLFHSIQF